MSDLNSNSLFLILLGIISGLLLLKNKLKIFSITLILVTIIIGYSITQDIIVSISIALILGNIIVTLNEKYKILKPLNSISKYTNNSNLSNIEAYCSYVDDFKKNNIENNNIKRSILPLKNDANIIESFSSKKVNEHFSDTDDDIVNDNNTENSDNNSDEKYESNKQDDKEDEYFIDSKGSFLENYKSLSAKQVKGLNKDTVDLIQTQKQLIETLKNMGPALKDGKEILDTFKNYFGNDKDISKMMSNFKIN